MLDQTTFATGPVTYYASQ